MLLTIALVVLALWLLGFLVDIGGGLINLLLVIAVIMIVVHLVRGRGATRV